MSFAENHDLLATSIKQLQSPSDPSEFFDAVQMVFDITLQVYLDLHRQRSPDKNAIECFVPQFFTAASEIRKPADKYRNRSGSLRKCADHIDRRARELEGLSALNDEADTERVLAGAKVEMA